jgi:hypothetical protein
MRENGGMAISREDLSRHYASLSDEELLALDPNELTDLALDCYQREVERRHLSEEGGWDDAAPEIYVPDEVSPDWLETAATACSFQVGSAGGMRRTPNARARFCTMPAFRAKWSTNIGTMAGLIS